MGMPKSLHKHNIQVIFEYFGIHFASLMYARRRAYKSRLICPQSKTMTNANDQVERKKPRTNFVDPQLVLYTSSKTFSLNSRSTFWPDSSVFDSPWRLRRAPRSNLGAFKSLTLRMWTFCNG